MVTMETEVEELLSLVINCGKDIDEAVWLPSSLPELLTSWLPDFMTSWLPNLLTPWLHYNSAKCESCLVQVTQLHTMSEVVKSGVAQAQEELRKEADNQIWQEGILRYGTVQYSTVQNPYHPNNTV